MYSLTKLKMHLAGWIFERAFHYSTKDYEKRLPKLLNIAKRFSPDEDTKNIVIAVEDMFKTNPEVQRLLHKIFTYYDHEYAGRILRLLLINVAFFWVNFDQLNKKNLQIPAPYTILISPTMRCNLNCVGCYAGNYTRDDDLSPHIVERIIKEGEDIGCYLYTILGGEPFVYPKLLDIVNNHPHSVFHIFTNGLLVDEKKIERFCKTKNVVLVISLEGDEEETDKRRGKGVFKKVVELMDILKKEGVPFGYSITLTKENFHSVGNPEFYQWLAEKGAFFGWTFLYMPVGRDDDPSLMPTPEQRAEYGRIIRKIRGSFPIYPMDFWNDAPYVGGCIAGGRRYIHINHKGEVEPCIFVHFAVDNIKEKSLIEVLRSPFFKEIRRRQPFHENLLLPCMIIDSPWILRELVEKYGAKPTHPGADDVLYKFKDEIGKYSEEVKRVLNPIWVEDFGGKPPIEEKKEVKV